MKSRITIILHIKTKHCIIFHKEDIVDHLLIYFLLVDSIEWGKLMPGGLKAGPYNSL